MGNSSNSAPGRPLAVLVVGPESTGSKLLARIVAHAVGAADFDEWNGSGWCGAGETAPGHRVCHRSMPYLLPPQWPDVEAIASAQAPTHSPMVVLTTRDRTISERSRQQRFAKSADQVAAETDRAVAMMIDLLRGPLPTHVSSYETLMLLGATYLQELYRFLGVESDFVPTFVDGNSNHLKLSGPP